MLRSIEDDDRLDKLVQLVRSKTPAVAIAKDSASDVTSVKGELAAGIRDVRQHIKQLDERLAAKKRVDQQLLA